MEGVTTERAAAAMTERAAAATAAAVYQEIINIHNVTEQGCKASFEMNGYHVCFINTDTGRTTTTINITKDKLSYSVKLLCIIRQYNNDYICTRSRCVICCDKLLTPIDGVVLTHRSCETTDWPQRLINLCNNGKCHTIINYINTHSFIKYSGITFVDDGPQGKIHCESVESNEVVDPTYYINNKLLRCMTIPFNPFSIGCVKNRVSRLTLQLPDSWIIEGANSNVISLIKK